MLSMKVLAQADICMSSHWYNRANYNPASIARPNYMYLFCNVRQQWVGVSGAPRVFNVQGSEYIHDLHSAFGLSLVADKIGVTQAFNPMLSYAYRIADDPTWAFSMGLSAGVFSRSIDGSLYDAEITSDPSIQYDMEKTLRPDANVGFEFQSTHFIFSLSSTHLLSIGKSDSLFLNSNHRYGSVVYKNSSPELFIYSLGFQVVNRNNLTVLEWNTCIRVKNGTGLLRGSQEIFDLGLTYRTSKEIALLFGLNISPNLKVGYAYIQSFIPRYYTNSTHEVMLEYRIPEKAASTRKCGKEGYWYR